MRRRAALETDKAAEILDRSAGEVEGAYFVGEDDRAARDLAEARLALTQQRERDVACISGDIFTAPPHVGIREPLKLAREFGAQIERRTDGVESKGHMRFDPTQQFLVPADFGESGNDVGLLRSRRRLGAATREFAFDGGER